MNDLSPEARALIRAAASARPSSRDRARLRAGLDAKLAIAVAASAAALTSSKAAASTAAASVAPAATAAAAGKAGVVGWLGKLVIGSAVIAGIGFGGREVVRAMHAPKPAITVPSAVAATASALAETAPPPKTAVEDVAAPEAPKAEAEPVPAKRPHRAARPDPYEKMDAASIAEEVALLRKAQSALQAGDSAKSLDAIDELEANHASGVLREERQAARVLALCAAGRADEARALGRAFIAKHPKSIQAPRVRASCAFEAAPKK
jgi:hypothetical protein